VRTHAAPFRASALPNATLAYRAHRGATAERDDHARRRSCSIGVTYIGGASLRLASGDYELEIRSLERRSVRVPIRVDGDLEIRPRLEK
jgi:hypothetical protein